MSEPIYFSTNSHPISNPTTQIMRVDLDGGFTVNESIPATDAAKMVLGLMKQEWLADAQCAKIRELLQLNKELVSEIERENERLKEQNKRQNEAIDSLQEMYAGQAVSDTPRMESVAGHARGIVDAGILAEGMKLERELNAANEMFRKLNIHALNLTDRIRRLEEAGDRLDSQIYCSCGMKIGCNDCEDAKSHWIKAKEAKP